MEIRNLEVHQSTEPTQGAASIELPDLCTLQIIDKLDGHMDARVCKAVNRVLNNNRLWESRFLDLQSSEIKSGSKYSRGEILSGMRSILKFASNDLDMKIPRGNMLEIYQEFKPRILEAARKHCPWPLIMAAVRGREKVVRWLLNNKISNQLAEHRVLGSPTHRMHQITGSLAYDAPSNPMQRELYLAARQALSRAAGAGHTEIVKFFLDREVADEDASEALSEAVSAGHTEIVKLFLDRGIAGREAREAFSQAVQKGRTEIVKLLLDSEVAGEDAGREFIQAVRNGHTEIAELLLDRGIAIQGSQDEIAVAAWEGHVEMVRLLIDHKFPCMDAAHTLSQVAEGGQRKMVKTLVAAGVDDEDGQVMLIAQQNDWQDIVDILQQRMNDGVQSTNPNELQGPISSPSSPR